MVERFGDYLLQFARSIDLVSEDDFNSIVSTVRDYSMRVFNLTYCELYLLNTNNEENSHSLTENQTLECWKHPKEEYRRAVYHKRIKNKEGLPSAQISYSFLKNKPIWIVKKNKNFLHERNADEQYQDLWSKSKYWEIPLYIRHDDNDTKVRTFVCYPLSVNLDHNNILQLGVLTFEFIEYFEPKYKGNEIKKEIYNIANGIAKLTYLKQSMRIQSSNTYNAIKNLEHKSNECFQIAEIHSFTQKPKLFFGFPKQGKEDIIKATKECLRRFEGLEPYFWDEDSQPININKSIFEKIRKSSYGVFYLSGHRDSSTECQNQQHEYVNNENVLIEIGMMLSMQKDWDASNIIIIREEDSPNAPFDIAAQKMIKVERDGNGELNKPTFTKKLKSFLKHFR